MGCGCGSSASTSDAHVWIDDKNVRHEFPSEIEAKAEMIRAGNVGVVQPA